MNTDGSRFHVRSVVTGGENQLVSNGLLLVGTVVVLLALDWRMALVAAFVFPLVELIIALTIASVLVYGAREAVGGAMTVGLIVSFTAYLRQALAPLPRLTALMGDFQQAATAL